MIRKHASREITKRKTIIPRSVGSSRAESDRNRGSTCGCYERTQMKTNVAVEPETVGISPTRKNNRFSPTCHKNGRPVFAGEPWCIREATCASRPTSCISVWHFSERRCRKSPQNYPRRTKKKKRDGGDGSFVAVSFGLASEKACCATSPLSFRLTSPFKLPMKETYTGNQPLRTFNPAANKMYF